MESVDSNYINSNYIYELFILQSVYRYGIDDNNFTCKAKSKRKKKEFKFDRQEVRNKWKIQNEIFRNVYRFLEIVKFVNLNSRLNVFKIVFSGKQALNEEILFNNLLSSTIHACPEQSTLDKRSNLIFS